MFFLDSLYKGIKFTDPQELLELVKASIKKCADSAMILGKLNQDLLTLRRDSITPELNITYKHLSFLQGEHPKLLFGDDLSRSIKEITETNKVGQCLSKKNFQSSPSGGNISLNSNTAGRNSGNKSFLYGWPGSKRKIQAKLPAEQSEKQPSISLQKQSRLSSLDHCYAKDSGEEVDFRKQVNIVIKNSKTKKDSFTAGFISKCVESCRETTSDKWILQTVSNGASIELEDLASIPLSTAHKTERLYSDFQKMLSGKEICKLLQKGVIKHVKNLEKGYVSSIFLKGKKKKATHRLILNLKKFNENVVYWHFKMDNLSTFLNMVRQDCYMASIDLADAYYTVPVLCMDQKYLLFQFEGN